MGILIPFLSVIGGIIFGGMASIGFGKTIGIVIGVIFMVSSNLWYFASQADKAEASDNKSCPNCGERIKKVAVKCKHCHSDLQKN